MSLLPRIKPTGRKIHTIVCLQCTLPFETIMKKQLYCSRDCINMLWRTEKYRNIGKINGSKGGKISAKNQSRRSKNEVYFSELCKNYFDITTNEPYFDGWDADIIIHSKKIAILWNGNWHYKQISRTQSLLQVQTRDKIKTDIIIQHGYIPYVIKDTGKYNKKFVEQEFEIFLFMQISLD